MTWQIPWFEKSRLTDFFGAAEYAREKIDETRVFGGNRDLPSGMRQRPRSYLPKLEKPR